MCFIIIVCRHQQELGQMQREKEKVIEEMEDAQAQCIALQATIQQLKTSLTDKVLYTTDDMCKESLLEIIIL